MKFVNFLNCLQEVELGYMLDIANIYMYLGDYEASLESYTNIYPFIKKIDNQNRKAYERFLNNLGSTFNQMNKPDSALNYYVKLLNFKNKIGASTDNVYLNIAASYDKKKEYTNALTYNSYLRKKGIFYSNNIKHAKILGQAGRIHIGMHNYDSALFFLQHTLINFLPTFNDSSVYVNPSLEVTNSEDALLYPLIRKGRLPLWVRLRRANQKKIVRWPFLLFGKGWS